MLKEKEMRIGALSELTGISARSLRYYEQQGLAATGTRRQRAALLLRAPRAV